MMQMKSSEIDQANFKKLEKQLTLESEKNMKMNSELETTEMLKEQSQTYKNIIDKQNVQINKLEVQVKNNSEKAPKSLKAGFMTQSASSKDMEKDQIISELKQKLEQMTRKSGSLDIQKMQENYENQIKVSEEQLQTIQKNLSADNEMKEAKIEKLSKKIEK